MKLAIIGGSLVSNINALTQVTEERIQTPFGEPSAKLATGKIGDIEVVYLNRHGAAHNLAPHLINYRANMFALKLLEVTHVVAIAAVGGISEKMSPMKCVMPDQVIDYTYGRMQTYNDADESPVHHIEFSYPFDEALRQQLKAAVEMADQDYEFQATYGATQGPRLETIAEIKRMHRDGCDIVGMTAMPEAALARELEMDYANLSLVVNWAAGAGVNDGEAPAMISMDEMKLLIADGNKIMERVIVNLMPLLSK